MNKDGLLDNHLPYQKDEMTFELAEQKTRFFSYLIDFVIRIILMQLLSIISFIFISGTNSTIVMIVFEYIFISIISVSYYTTIESLTQGCSVGKLITKTRAINDDGTALNFYDALMRSFCRLIPFDAFSYLGKNKSGWHDRFSNTIVIKDIGWKEWSKS